MVYHILWIIPKFIKKFLLIKMIIMNSGFIEFKNYFNLFDFILNLILFLIYE
jgi:hypothetical protein